MWWFLWNYPIGLRKGLSPSVAPRDLVSVMMYLMTHIGEPFHSSQTPYA
jgi:hypothetical protein